MIIFLMTQQTCFGYSVDDLLNPQSTHETSFFTVIGALAKYISTENDKFQPMNANFGILPELEGKKIKDKKERYMKLAERSLKNLK